MLVYQIYIIIPYQDSLTFGEACKQVPEFNVNLVEKATFLARLARAPLEISRHLRACAYRLKCSPMPRINFFFGKVPSSLSKMRYNLEFSCHKTTKL